jgi:hypothetical protein
VVFVSFMVFAVCAAQAQTLTATATTVKVLRPSRGHR